MAIGKTLQVWWTVVECACRILGISTAAVLCAVGVETLKQEEFHSLAIYLVVSSVGIMLVELAYFADAALIMCLPCPPDWQLFVLCGKLAHLGSFQKFLYNIIMSLICFLHPVLVWHAVIPGTMLLVTGIFNFILSKKTKARPSKGSQGSYTDQPLTTVCMMETGGSESTFSFSDLTGSRGAGLVLTPRESSGRLGDTGESLQAMLKPEQTAEPREEKRESRRFKHCWGNRGGPVERETEELEECYEPETTSDKAPMITD